MTSLAMTVYHASMTDDAAVAKVLTEDEARRIAANIGRGYRHC